MSDRHLDDSMEDLALDEAEGAADGYEDEADFGEGDESGEDDEFLRGLIGGIGRVAGGLLGGGGGGDGFDEFAEGDGADEGDALDEGDEFDAGDGYDTDAFENAVADALDAGDSDEFLRRIGNIARNVGRAAGRVGRTVGNVARVVAPIASAIPLPQAQAIGRIANVVGRLMADGADEFEALEELFDYAESDDIDAAAPVIAGLAIRQRMPGVARAPRPVRRQVVRGVTRATRTLTRAQGPRAARAVPAVVQRVQQGVRRRRVPPRRAGAAAQRVAQRVAQSPRAVQQLVQRARAAAPARVRRMHAARAAGMGGVAPIAGTCPSCRRTRTFNLRGPVQISIRGH
jgi:hypothetical protein